MARACTAIEFIILGMFDRLLQEMLENINYGDDDTTAAALWRDILQTEFKVAVRVLGMISQKYKYHHFLQIAA